MKVELIDVAQVIPYVNNPRKNEAAVAKVAASIKEFGFRQPIVVDINYTIIVGHTRLLAARALGLAEVPIHIAEGLTEAQIKAYRIADNRSNQEAQWDDELLKIELGDLESKGFNLELTGFDLNELDNLLLSSDNGTCTDDDLIPAIVEKTVTKPGDLWILGKRHRLLCADSTDPKSIDTIMAGNTAHMIFTDPPYNVDYMNDSGDKIHNDNLGEEFYSFLLSSCKNMLKVCKGAAYICMSASELHTLHKAFTSAGGHWSTFIVWVKNHFALGRSDYQRQYETILYGWLDGNKHHWCGDRNQSDVWNFAKPSSNDLHPTMKPVELVSRAIENSSRVKDFILDPFAGSGSTLIACEKLNRSARLIEIDPKYCDVIIRRWQDLTGDTAIHGKLLKSFKEISTIERE
ncbi:MAG: DNA modification methylase [Rickettsiales bacterium]